MSSFEGNDGDKVAKLYKLSIYIAAFIIYYKKDSCRHCRLTVLKVVRKFLKTTLH